jgi:hypothetical protein
MTAALLEKPVCRQSPLDGGGTLEELLTSALREAAANGSTECPVCHARMSSTRVGAREAECGGCGSRLS